MRRRCSELALAASMLVSLRLEWPGNRNEFVISNRRLRRLLLRVASVDGFASIRYRSARRSWIFRRGFMGRAVFILREVLLAIGCVVLVLRAPALADDLPLAESVTSSSAFLDFEVGAQRGLAVGYEEELPAAEPSTEPLVEMEKAITEIGKAEEKIVYLGDGPPPAYSFGYNRVRSATTWLPGHDDRFGWLSYESFGGAKVNNWPTLVSGFGVHFLDGPVQTDMPPRLFDFSIGVQDRRLVQPNIGYDLVFRVGAFSDFEGSAEDGVRYPSHAVTFFRFNPRMEMVLGVDVLDRDDISLLPVAGMIWRPADWLRLEAVFPRPRLAARIMDTTQWIFLGGELGGGTWAVERVGFVDDNATYRDLRLVLGWETVGEESLNSSFEIGYVFDRELSYRSSMGDYEPPDGFMLRMTARY